jgi:hypothetical protein
MSLIYALAFSIVVIGDNESFTSDMAVDDPVVPPALRQAPREKPAGGEELRQQVVQKLRARFDAADTDHDTRLTQSEAKAGGLGFVSSRFTEIDTAQRGSVSFDDIRKYMQAQQAHR